MNFVPRVSPLLILIACFVSLASAQTSSRTAEDSLHAAENSTAIGGYGNALYQRDFNQGTSSADLERVVIFVGHNFGSVSFFSELEMEDAKVEGGDDGGEIAFEQAYLKFNLDQTHYIAAGLFLPRIGITNENHLPGDFNGNERPFVETYIIPATWRELGIGFYGTADFTPLNYNVALVNGLSSATFAHGSGIREGRFEGRNASANNLAVTGAVQFYTGDVKMQASGYYGGSVGLGPRQADSLQLTSGVFGTPVGLVETDAVYDANGFTGKILGTIISIPNASEINRAYANNTPESEYGAYVEVGYDLLRFLHRSDEKRLVLFARLETLDMNASIPANGISDGSLKQRHIISGLTYFPIGNVVIKADVRFEHTGDQNQALILNPNPAALPYKNNNVFLNVGLGYSF
ncbi:MAG TPA: hypothetical protein VMM58_05945 [Bacteroidota bacterium]|nr:hypothetical protein [Bacteroidota bacterium]